MRPAFVVVLLLLWAPALPAAENPLRIVQSPPTVVTKYFDPAKPPADMPPLSPPESAVTVSEFDCNPQIQSAVTGDPAGTRRTATITTLTVNLNLTVTIWLPHKPDAKLIAHEEGHRRIAEIYYKDANELAQPLVRKLIGRKYTAQGPDVDAQLEAMMKKDLDALCKDYLDAVHTPCQAVQNTYDDLTRHGTNDLPEDNAIQQAMEQQSKAKATR